MSLEELNPQGLSSTAWAFATLGVQHEELLGAIAGRALARLEEFSPQNAAGVVGSDSEALVWAQRSEIRGSAMLSGIGKNVLARLQEFSPQNSAPRGFCTPSGGRPGGLWKGCVRGRRGRGGGGGRGE